MGTPNNNNILLQCPENNCNILSLSVVSLLRHMGGHNFDRIFCGIENCPLSCRSVKYLRSHLRNVHPHIFTSSLLEISSGENSFIRIFSNEAPSETLHRSEESHFRSSPDSEIINRVDDINENFDITIENSSPINNFIDESYFLHQDFKKKFLEHIIVNGFGKFVSFKAIKNILDGFLDLFDEIGNSSLNRDDFIADCKHCLLNSDNLDYQINDHFDSIYPVEIFIGTTKKSFVYFNLKESIERLVSEFDSFEEFLTEDNNVESNEILYRNFFDSGNPKEKDTIYLNVFCDDFQLANPLLATKSLKNEFCGQYFRIISKNLFKYSKKSSIKLLTLCKTSIFNSNMNDIYEFVAKELHSINETGIRVTKLGQAKDLKVKIGFFSFDSKAASEILGMKKGFTHNYCCRFCLTKRDEFKSCSVENHAILRSEASYRQCLSKIDPGFSDGYDYRGIQRESPLRFFNQSDFFTLSPPCISHDIFEGVGMYILKQAINTLSNESSNGFNYDILKKTLEEFVLIGNDQASFPSKFPKLPQSLRFQANECYYFFRFFLYITRNILESHEVVDIIQNFVGIINIIQSYAISENDLVILESRIDAFLQKCVKVFPTMSITVKFHHMIHYPRLIAEFGPLRLCSTINFESHHSFLKKLAHSSKNWKNPAITIGQAYARATAVTNSTDALFGKTEVSAFDIDENLQNHQKFTGTTVYQVKSAIFNGITYKSGGLGGYFSVDMENTTFNKIDKVFSVEQKLFFQITRHAVTSQEDLNIYLIENPCDESENLFECCDDLIHPNFLHLYKLDNNYVIPYYKI